jgi:hypothetical protein
LERLAMPDTLRGVIAARIDRLPQEAKATLQHAAVMGLTGLGGTGRALDLDQRSPTCSGRADPRIRAPGPEHLQARPHPGCRLREHRDRLRARVAASRSDRGRPIGGTPTPSRRVARPGAWTLRTPR